MALGELAADFQMRGVARLTRGLMVSIVDDDQSIHEAARALVSSLGYSAATFVSAEGILESGQLGETACVITDVLMPGMSGIELQNHLIASGDRTPVILITAFLTHKGCMGAPARHGSLRLLSEPFSEDSPVPCLDWPWHTDSRAVTYMVTQARSMPASVRSSPKRILA